MSINGKAGSGSPHPRPAQAPGTDWAIDPAAFAELLRWLGPDPEAAGHAYELIRRRLMTLFRCRDCACPEDLADETINRVIRKLPQVKPSYRGHPALYFYGVAKKVCQEYWRRRAASPPPAPVPAVRENREELLQHLDDALSRLESADRKLILDYYCGDKQGKIDHRKAMAREMGLPLSALRLRVHRIRCQLKKELVGRRKLTFSEPVA